MVSPARRLRVAFAYLLVLFFVVELAGCGEGGPGVNVSDFTPQGEVERATNFTVIFSKDVVGDSLTNVPLDAAPITFTPALPGQFQWIAANKLRFYPDVMLAPSTEYQAEVEPRAVSAYGLALKGTRRFTFQTPRLRVVSAFLNFDYNPDTSTRAALAATIEFNSDVDPEVVADHVAIRYKDGRRIPYQLTTTGSGRVVTFEAPAVERGEDEQQIELYVREGLVGLGGNLGLASDYTRGVMLPGQNSLKVEQMVSVRESASSQYVKVRFNLPISGDRVASFISVEPDVDVQATGSHTYLTLRGDFQTDETYQVTIREGMMAIDGSQLGRDFSGAVTFRQENIPPQLDFVGDGFYLSRNGHLNLGLSTINLDKVTIEVDKIYANNLVYVLNAYDFAAPEGYYYWNADLSTLGTEVYREDLVVSVEANEEVVTPIAIESYLREQRAGIFKVTARKTEERWDNVSRWVVATDLGLMTKEAGDDLWVWVNSLTSLDAQQNAEVTLYSRNNQVLGTARTGEDGVAVFTNYRQRTEGFEPFLITAALGDDLAFVELTRRRLATSDFEVGGMPYLQNGYEAFVYNERGVFRPGETVHLGAVVRGPNAAVPQPFPLRLRVTGPDGKVLDEQRTRLNEQGGTDFSIDVPDYALTGAYTAALLIGDNQEIGRTAFSIEEFVPDRMKVRADTDAQTYRPGESVTIDVEGITLFGPPAAGRRVQAQVELEPYPFAPEAYRRFTFGNPERSFVSVEADLEDALLDDQGRVRLAYTLPRNLQPPASLRLVVEATVLEPGGRGVTAYAGAVVHPYDAYVGLRPLQEGYAEPGKAFPLEFVVVDANDESVPGRTVQVSLYKIFWNSIWRQQADGRYRYVSERTERVEAQQTLTTTGGVGRFEVTPEEYGSYKLVAEDPASGASTVLSFYSSGWGYEAWAMDSPDRVELELDKERYRPGEKAKVLVRAPYAGKLLLTVEREQVFDHFVTMLDGNTATLEVPITGTYKPNVYLSAHLIRSTDGLDRDESARAFGVVPLHVDTDPYRLAVSLDAPAEMRPQNPLTVDVRVQGSQDRAYVTLAAVDVGITQLTDFQTPDPHGFFYGKKRLEVETYDLYGVILPEVPSSLSSPAGDIEAARRRRVNPAAARRVKPVAYWSGVIETDREGRGRVTFDIPQFNGTVRLMAVAYAGDRFSSVEQEVLIRDPIVMTPTLPRFLGSGDRFSLPVSVFNGTGSEASFDVRLALDGPVTMQGAAVQTLQVPSGREGQVYFDVAADPALGKATFRLTAEGGGQATQDEIEVPVRPPVPYTTLGGSGTVEAGQAATLTFPGDFLPGTDTYELVLSSLPTVQFAGSLQYLLRYPHGCLEQTTSRVFPLLAFNDLAQLVEPALFQRSSADYFIEEGIEKLEQMMMPSGAFAYWPGGQYTNTWSSIYASHFLVEARRAGYVVSERVYDRMLDALAATARDYSRVDRYTLEQSAYAVYVLALAGKPERSTQLYLKNNALDDLPTYARYQLAGALALSGNDAAARALLPQQAVPAVSVQERETGRNFNSGIRSKAIMLDILTEIDPGSPQVPALVQDLADQAARGRWYTTQENAFAFLALGKVYRAQAQVDFTGRLLVGGQEADTFDESNHRFTSEAWEGATITLDVSGTGTAYYFWRADGLPASLNVDEYDHDLVVRRRFLTERGNPLPNYENFRQGDVIVAELTIRAPQERLENVAVVDLLPAGLEIENPRLQSRAGVDWIEESDFRPDHLDIRDDRLILYGNFEQGETVKFYYGVRAVTAGTFKLPPVRAEAMYAPTKASVASSGRVVVRPQGGE